MGEAARQIRDRVSAHDGEVGLVILEPRSDRCLLLNENERFEAGSLSAVPIMVETLSRVAEDVISVEDPLTVLEIDKVEGTGVLLDMSAPRTISVWDAMYLMTTVSDHTAANLILDKLRPLWVTKRMGDLGLRETRILMPFGGDASNSFDPDAAERFGHAVTTPLEMATLFAWIQAESLMGAQGSTTIGGILEQELSQDGIPRHLPHGIQVAHKAAVFEDHRHDCGVVRAPSTPFVICAMTRANGDHRTGLDNEATSLIADIAATTYHSLNTVTAARSTRNQSSFSPGWAVAVLVLVISGGGAAVLRTRRNG